MAYTDYTSIIDPGQNGHHDFASLFLWEAGFGGVPGSGDNVTNTAKAFARCFSSDGTEDTTGVTIDGWAGISSAYNCNVETYDNSPAFHYGSVPDGTGQEYVLSTVENALIVREVGTVVRRITVKTSKDTQHWAMYAWDPCQHVVFAENIVKCTGAATGASRGISFFTDSSATGVYRAHNNLVLDYRYCLELYHLSDPSAGAWIFHNTFVGSDLAPPILVDASSAQLMFVNNLVWSSYAGAYSDPNNSTAAFSEYCRNNLVKTDWPFAYADWYLGSATKDDVWMDYSNDDYNLAPNSPAIGRGLNLAVTDWCNFQLLTDIRGKSRVQNSTARDYDIGAFARVEGLDYQRDVERNRLLGALLAKT